MLTLESMFRLSQYPLKRLACRHHVFPVHLSCFRLHFFFIFRSHDSGIELVNYALINGMTKCFLLPVPQMVGKPINITYKLTLRSVLSCKTEFLIWQKSKKHKQIWQLFGKLSLKKEGFSLWQWNDSPFRSHRLVIISYINSYSLIYCWHSTDPPITFGD